MAKWLKRLGKGLGKALSVAAPVLAMTGVGAPLAMAAGAAGGALQGGKPKQWLKRAGIGAGVAGLGALAKGTGAVGKVGGWLSKAKGAAAPAMQALGGAPGAPGAGGMVRSLAELAPVALGAVGAVQGNRDLNRARELDSRMLAMAEQEHAARGPMRDLAMQMMQRQMQPMGSPPQPPASMFRSSNPFGGGT